MRRALARRLLAAAAGLAFVGAVLAYVGPATVVATLAGADPALLALAFTSYLLFFVVRGVRWAVILRPMMPQATAVQAGSASAFGWLVSTWVPLKAGDVTRAAMLARRHRTNLFSVGGTVGLERALDILGLAGAATIALMAMEMYGEWHLPPLVARAVGLAWILPLAGLAGLLVLGRVLGPRAHRHRILRMADHVVDATRWLASRPRQVLPMAGLTALAVALQSLLFAALLLAFHPGAAVLPAAAGAPLFLLSFIVSVTPGNVGTYEAAFVAVYALLGFDALVLLPIAVAVHLCTITFVTFLGGAGWIVFNLAGRPAADMGTAATAATEATP